MLIEFIEEEHSDDFRVEADVVDLEVVVAFVGDSSAFAFAFAALTSLIGINAGEAVFHVLVGVVEPPPPSNCLIGNSAGRTSSADFARVKVTA